MNARRHRCAARPVAGLTLAVVLGFLAPAPYATAQERGPEVLLEEARYERDIRGDLQAAIRVYERIVESHGEHRDVAARALLELGDVYGIVGREEAREAYSRVLTDYSDQVEAARAARSRLASLEPEAETASANPARFTMRRLWAAPVGFTVRSLSPDGRRVVFIDWGDGVKDPAFRGEADVAIYNVETDRGSLVTHMLPQSVKETYPSAPIWSRDGRWIAYSHWDDDWTHQRLHLVRPDGTDDRVLVDNEQFANLEAMDFSGNGDFIVARIRGWDEVYRIALVSTNDGGVTFLKTEGSHPPHPLSLSPDDRFIVYDQLEEGVEGHDIHALAVDGSGEFQLSDDPADDELPYWAPAGDRVVFLSDRSGRPALWSVRVENGRAVGKPRLARDNVGDMYPLGFTADGGLYYTLPIRRTDVFTATLDRKTGQLAESRLLARTFIGTNSRPAWAPDGRRLAFVSRRGSAADEYHIVVREPATGEERALALPFVPADRWEIDWSENGAAVDLGSGSRREWQSYRVDVASGEVNRMRRRDPAGFAGGSYALASDRQERFLRSSRIRVAGQNDFPLFEAGQETVGSGETLLLVRDGVRRYTGGPGGEAEALTPLGHSHAWRLSPDGRTLAVAISSDPDVAVSDVLYLVPVTGGDARELVRTGTEEMRQKLRARSALDEIYNEQEILAVQWTPDGERLLYAVGEGRTDGAVEYWMVGLDGSDRKRLDWDMTFEQFAGLSFRPDGGAVAFTREERFRELWLMRGLEW